MKHLSEEEQLDIYYEEGSESTKAHLKACRECSAEYANLKRSLDAIKPEAIPQRGSDYGEQVWQKLQSHLVPYERKASGWRSLTTWMSWRSAAVAVGCAVLLAAAFVGGRYWEHLNSKRQADTAVNSQPQQRVVVVVLTDHLDRTERLLVQLNHANSADKAENAQLQSEARELLASNRLYRVTASKEGDPALAGALDRLERVLAEIANDPHLTAADLDRVRSDMNTSGILFEVRVLLARKPNQEGGPTSAKGVSI
jgi:hypothetical protein